MAVEPIAVTQNFVTTPDQATTFFADGVKGVSVSQGIVKISFFEQFVDTSADTATPSDGVATSMKARHVANIVLEHQSFLSVLDLLNMVRDDLLKVPNASA